MQTTIRAARRGEVAELQRIQVAAGAAFRQVGMPDVADNPPLAGAVLAGYVDGGRGWVAADEADAPIGFVVVDRVDDAAHVEQVSVAPTHARRGVGARLIERVAAWAAGHGLPAVSLTTFRRVPFNAPYYARFGFVEVPAAERGPGLAAILAAEADWGLDPADRVAMRRPSR